MKGVGHSVYGSIKLPVLRGGEEKGMFSRKGRKLPLPENLRKNNYLDYYNLLDCRRGEGGKREKRGEIYLKEISLPRKTRRGISLTKEKNSLLVLSYEEGEASRPLADREEAPPTL